MFAMFGSAHAFDVVFAIGGIIIGLGGIIATGLFYGMVHSQRESVEFLKVANEGLRGALEDSATKAVEQIAIARNERETQIRALEGQLHEESRRCAAETAELRGQIHALQDGVVAAVATSAADTVAKGLVDELMARLDQRSVLAVEQLVQGQQALLEAIGRNRDA